MERFEALHDRRFGARSARGVIMSVMLVVAMFVGMGLDRVLVETGIAATSLTQADEFETLEETYEAIRQFYVLQGEISDQELIYGAARGMVDALGDTGHSTFLDPEQARAWDESISGNFVGIGVTVDTTGRLPVIIAPMQNSPAFEAGILPGDTILAVDGIDLVAEGIEATDAVDLVRGEVGTQVTLELERASGNEVYEVTITRAEIEINPVSWVMLPNGIMWLQLDQFSQGATNGIRDAIRQGEELGMTGLIFDVRGNPGGLVYEAIGVASQFLPENTPVYQEADADGNASIADTRSSRGVYRDGPMVVLVNGNSASSAEIVSSALQEAGRAELYGETTFGVGTVLMPLELSDGSMAVLGTSQLLTASGQRIFQVGVEPTNVVELGESQVPGFIIIEDADQDNQLTAEELQAIEDDQLHAAFEAVSEMAGQ
jgi:carboxyl-terminal processing protease